MKAGLIELARQRAAEVMARARQDAEAVRQERVQSGYQEGLVAGRQQAEQAMLAWKEAADAALEDYRHTIELRVNEDLARLEPHLLDLVMTLVRQVVKQEVEGNRSVIRSQVEVAVSSLGKSMVKSIRVNPGDLNHLLDAGLAGLPLVGDATIRQGGCSTEGDGIAVDATIETQLNRLEEELHRRD